MPILQGHWVSGMGMGLCLAPQNFADQNLLEMDGWCLIKCPLVSWLCKTSMVKRRLALLQRWMLSPFQSGKIICLLRTYIYFSAATHWHRGRSCRQGSFPPSHSVQTRGQPVLALFLWGQLNVLEGKRLDRHYLDPSVWLGHGSNN